MRGIPELSALHHCIGFNLIREELVADIPLSDFAWGDFQRGIYDRSVLTSCGLIQALQCYNRDGVDAREEMDFSYELGKTGFHSGGQKMNLAKSGRKVFVKNINFRSQRKDMWDFFSYFGEIEFCQILKDNRNRSRGFGFVNYKEQESAQKALQASADDLFFDGRQLSVEPAVWKKKSEKIVWSVRDDDGDSGTLQPSNDQGGFDNTSSHMNGEEGQQVEEPHSSQREGEQQKEEPNLNDNEDMSEMSDCPIATLNQDVLLHVFSMLTLKERVSIETVCKRWQRLLVSSWQHIDTLKLSTLAHGFGGLTDRALRCVLKRTGGNLRHLDMSGGCRRLTDRGLEAVGQRCPNLVELDMSGLAISNTSLKLLAEKCTRLQRVHFKDSQDFGEKGLWWLFNKCKALTDLSLEGNTRLTGQCFHVIGPNLKCVNLNSCHRLQDLGIAKLAERSCEVETLRLNACTSLTAQCLVTIDQKFKSLKSLHLCSSLRAFSDSTNLSAMQCIAGLSQLEELCIASVSCMNDSVLAVIARGCKQLRVVDISQCNVTDAGLDVLCTCLNLQDLRINYLHDVTDLGLERIIRNGGLRNLTARGCGGITNTTLERLGSMCVCLEEADLSGCLALTNHGVQAFIDNVTVRGGSGVPALVLGGSSVVPEALQMSPHVRIDMNNFCDFRLTAEARTYMYLGMDEQDGEENDGQDDEDNEDNDDDYREEGPGYDRGFGDRPGLSPESAEDFLIGDDPLLDEEWDLS